MAFRLLEGGAGTRLLEGSSDRRLLETASDAPGLTMTRVLQDPCAFPAAGTNCYFHDTCVACMTGTRYRWLNWEGRKANALDANLAESQFKIWKSDADEGVTWFLLATLTALPVTLQYHLLFSPANDILIVGGQDKTTATYNASYSFISRSLDGGATWSSAVASNMYVGLTANVLVKGFFCDPSDPTVVYAYGSFPLATGTVQFLRSTDSGTSFEPWGSDTGESHFASAVAITSTLFAGTGNAGVSPFYSADAGVSWTAGTKPAGTVTGNLAMRSDGAVVAMGRTAASLAGTQVSTDNGQTYSATGSPPDGSNNGAKTIVAYNADVMVGGGNSPSGTGTLQKWWVTGDGGTTWADSEYIGDRVASCDASSILVTTSGVILAGLDRITAPATVTDQFGEIWRGTLSAVPAFYTPSCGPAEEDEEEVIEPPPFVVPLAAGRGARALCGPAFMPTPCTQHC